MHGQHIPDLGQEFWSWQLMGISFGVLASEFSVEYKNSHFARVLHHFFFFKKSQGVPHGLKIFTEPEDTHFEFFEKKFMKHPSKMVHIFGFYTKCGS